MLKGNFYYPDSKRRTHMWTSCIFCTVIVCCALRYNLHCDVHTMLRIQNKIFRTVTSFCQIILLLHSRTVDNT